MEKGFDHQKIMEKMLGEGERPLIEPVPGKPGEFREIKRPEDQSKAKDVKIESEPILSAEEMKRIEQGALKFEEQEKLVEKALAGKITPEELNEHHPYYGVKFEKKSEDDKNTNEKKKKPLDDSLEFNFK